MYEALRKAFVLHNISNMLWKRVVHLKCFRVVTILKLGSVYT